MDKLVEVTDVDRDAWEQYGPAIFHGDITGPEAFARHRIASTPTDAARIGERERCARLCEDAAERAELVTDYSAGPGSDRLAIRAETARKIAAAIRVLPAPPAAPCDGGE